MLSSIDRFHIQLMTRGRMKGQAFVTFLSSSLALKAIDESNGYVLKGKPIVAVSLDEIQSKRHILKRILLRHRFLRNRRREIAMETMRK